VTADFLKAAAAALTENGTLRIATDQSEYFEHICRCAEQSADFAISKGNGHADFPPSAFENRFKRAGAQIYLLELRKVSPVT
jgi:tRNA G46 methylase TrmB